MLLNGGQSRDTDILKKESVDSRNLNISSQNIPIIDDMKDYFKYNQNDINTLRE